jgi:regulatory protein
MGWNRSPRAKPERPNLAMLENAALSYLGRYASSSANLRRVLLRRFTRTGEPPTADDRKMIEDIVARYLTSGLLDDRAYAAQQAASLHRRGTSRHAVRGRLAQKGVDAELIDAALGPLEEAGGELAAAAALARRRRLGPYRPAGKRAELRQRDLAALARAGFNLAIARKVLAARDPEALLRLVQGEDAED